MESAFKTPTSDERGSDALVIDSSKDDAFAARERDIVISQLQLYRDRIDHADTADKASWQKIISALFSAGFKNNELETELAASPNTLYKWREGLAAPRELTRKLLRRAILEMVDERIAAMHGSR